MPSGLLWEVWSWDILLIFILYTSMMWFENPAYTHMHGLILCCHYPHIDGETEAQRGHCFPMVLAKLGVALLYPEHGPVCGACPLLHHCLISQKYEQTLSCLPDSAPVFSSWTLFLHTFSSTLSSPLGWRSTFRTQSGPPDLTLSPGVVQSGHALFYGPSRILVLRARLSH